jgi:hypothetical protein
MKRVAIQCRAALSQRAIETSEVENPAVETVVSAWASASKGVIATSQYASPQATVRAT